MIIAIDRGRLCTRDTGLLAFNQKATAANARRLGRKLAELGVENVLYSSTIDFPKESGGPDLDFRSLIQEGMAEAEEQEIQAGAERVIKRMRKEFGPKCRDLGALALTIMGRLKQSPSLDFPASVVLRVYEAARAKLRI